MKEPSLVSVVMGSDSDYPVMEQCLATLEELGVACDVQVLSAHRSPEKVRQFASGAEERGVRVIIAAAGGAAHLAGVIAAHTALPVVGVPMPSGLDGLDSLLSTVQMPSGVPVATVSIGKAGAVNAAVLAGQMIGIADKTVRERIKSYKEELSLKVDQKNEALRRNRGA